MWRKLGIEPGEGRVFAWGAAALFLLGWADVSVKNVAETLFIKRVGVERLPLVFLVNSILLVGTTYLLGRVASWADRLRLLTRVFVALAIALVPLWFLVLEDMKSAFVLLVIASKQLQSIGLMMFWIALADLLHGRQSKRLFAPLMAGMTLGTILGSFASEPISRIVGIEGLLPLSTGALVFGACMTWPLRHLRARSLERPAAGSAPRLDDEPADSARESVATLQNLWSDSRLFRLLFVTAVCAGLLGPMLYFQFSYVANLATQGAGGEQKLMEFYAQFRGWIGVGVLGVQLGVTTNLYRRIGIPLAAAISPLIYLLGFLGLSVRLSLPAGVGAMAGTKLQDNAVYDPAVRILYNLLPENIRARAMGLLEGPVKRAGGALGNVVTIAAVGLGTAAWVGGTALPIAAVWLAVSVVLWRAYPALLMQVSSRPANFGDDFDFSELLDSNTLRALSGHLLDPDPARCRVAVDLVSEAKPEMAAEILAEAARAAGDTTRPLLIAAMDRVLEGAVASDVVNEAAAAHLEALLDDRNALGDSDHADVVQAYGRLTAGTAASSPETAPGSLVLARALGDRSPAVRLAAVAALHRRGTPPQGVPDLHAALRDGLADEDRVLRRTAREEYRALLIRGESSGACDAWIAELARLLEREPDRADAAEALADIAAEHGERSASVRDLVFPWRDDRDPRVRAAVLRFIGHAGLEDHSGWLVSHVVFDEGEGSEPVRTAAREGLRALGARAADALLVELSFGKRSTREAILPLVRAIDVKTATLRDLYERELDAIRRKLVDLHAAVIEGLSPILLQRLGERLDESVHTALQLLGAVHDDDRIAGLAVPLCRARGGRRHAILLEALEALLSPAEKDQLMPLLEDRPVADRGDVAAKALAIPVPSGAQVARQLLESPDELTRSIAEATLAAVPGLAAAANVQDDDGVLSPVERAMLLRSVPLFEGMTTRQLMNVADVVEQEVYGPDSFIARKDDYSDCMYIIVEGTVAITTGETELNTLGPNDFFGEIAVFEGATRSANVVTREGNVSLLRLGRDDLLSLMEELPGIAIHICKTLAGRVRILTERVNV
jgi:AAA family ATP:ADP antiporter